MMVGGALVNALAFTGSNFLFGQLSKDRVDAERKWHDLALEKTLSNGASNTSII